MPNPVPLPESYGTKLRELEDRLEAIELGRRARYGLATAGGSELLDVTQDGWAVPVFNSEWRRPLEAVVVTAGSFATVWRTDITNWLGDGLIVSTLVTVDASTTAELRLNVAGVGTSGVLALGAGAFQPAEWRWEHPAPINGASTRQVNLEARRVSGAGNVTVYEPEPTIVASGLTGLTATGL